MRRTRKSVAVLCITLVVFAVFVPGAVPTVADALFIPLWIVIPATVVIVVRRNAIRCDEQPVSLLSLVLSRAPPLHVVPA